MCGICGELRLDGRPAREPEVMRMRDRIAHRGPDASGLYVSPDGGAGLGFRRLRIIDLSSNADQPMANEDGSVRIVFNGEIYNFRELRARCAGLGHRFRSQSDTEVIVHLYEELGADAIRELDGMFALAIWDEPRRRLTLARDRAGKKPLFYYHSDGLFAFASEMKSFFAHPDIPMGIDPAAIPSYFMFGYVPHPRTFYANVHQVAPGGILTVGEDGRVESSRYWRIAFPEASEVRTISRQDAAAGVRERLTRAVEKRLVSDVPLGAFLSGGLDSTIVVGLMSQLMREPVKTFSIGFEGDAAYDETSFARIASERFGTDHTEFRVSSSAIDLIDTLLWHHDGPFGDSSAVPTYIVSRLTREKVTVVLTGDGGDELFAGYLRFYAALLADRIPRSAARLADAVLSALPTPASDRHPVARARRFARSLHLPFDRRLATWAGLFVADVGELLRPEMAATLGPIDPLDHLRDEWPAMEGRSPLSRALHMNFVSYLADDLLVKTDRCTMANALEARAPFLDRELIEYVTQLPDEHKLRGRETKSILREAFADLVPPQIQGRGKMGFGVPLDTWFRGELREYMRDLLLDPGARYREFLNGTFVERLVERQVEGTAHLGHQLWSLICFERWLRLLPDWRAGSVLPERPDLSDLHANRA
jgi:asparagine synthase (glutamine-hydrolysing)